MNVAKNIEENLSGLQIGERCWFWFCPDTEASPLLLESFSKEDGMSLLLEKAEKIEIPQGALVCTGMASLSAEGVFQFASPLFEEDMLPVLSGWVKVNYDSYPGLAALHGARFMRVAPNGQIKEAFSDEDAWKGVPRVSRIGTLEASANLLAQMGNEHSAWIWISEQKSGAPPLVVVNTLEDDPKATLFNQMVFAGRQRSVLKTGGVRGVVKKIGGVLLITTADELDGVGESLEKWFEQFSGVRFVQIENKEIVDSRIIGKTASIDLTKLVEALRQVKNGKNMVFYFTNVGKDGQPVLMMNSSLSDLKSQVKSISGDAPMVRGEVQMAKWGVEFRARNRYPDLLPQLAAWVETHHGAWPDLRVLVNARMTLRDKEGTILEKFKSDSVWDAIRNAVSES